MRDEDNSWEVARRIVESELQVPSPLRQLVRNAWSGNSTTQEFMQLLGFTGVSGRCLFQAAEVELKGDAEAGEQVAQVIQYLGLRYSAVVISINYTFQRALRSHPPSKVWQEIYKEAMKSIQVGYKFGGLAEGVGSEGGMLIGFMRSAGLATLMGHDIRVFVDWYKKTRGHDSSGMAHDSFGCESYQVGSFVLQQLGFGPDIAFGAALAVGNLRSDLCTGNEQTMTWRAAYDWVQALMRGEKCPRNRESRQTFGDLMPGADFSPQLEALYNDIGEIRRAGSNWTWHLPAGSYEATDELVTQARQKSYVQKRQGSGAWAAP